MAQVLSACHSFAGLSGDKTLVLINGKRRHRSALVRLGGGRCKRSGSRDDSEYCCEIH